MFVNSKLSAYKLFKLTKTKKRKWLVINGNLFVGYKISFTYDEGKSTLIMRERNYYETVTDYVKQFPKNTFTLWWYKRDALVYSPTPGLIF